MKGQNGHPATAAEPTPFSEMVDDIIKKHVLMSSGSGLIPLPGLDVAAVTAIQVHMIRELAEAYEKPFEHQKVRSVLSALTFSTIARLFSYGASTLFDPNERFGSWSESLTNAAVMGFFTGAVGMIYSMHFAEGGTLDDLGVEEFIAYTRKQVKSGELNPASIFSISSRLWQAL